MSSELSTVAAVIVFGMVASSLIIVSGLKRLASIIYSASLRSALVANFSRFGQFGEDTRFVISSDEKRGYFLRDEALWGVELKNRVMIKSTAKQIDAISIPLSLLEEVTRAVDALNSDFGPENPK
jgi:hypothetical protein